MPNDAKFGLVVGVVLVLTAAVMFFGNDAKPDAAVAVEPPAPRAAPSASQPGFAAPGAPVEARTTTHAPGLKADEPPNAIPSPSPP